MAKLIKILSEGIGCSKADKTRVWMKPAEPIVINDLVHVTVFFDRVDDEYKPLIIARSQKGEALIYVPSDSYQELLNKVGMIIVPVAIEENEAGIANRMMIDIFQAKKIDFRQQIA